MSKARSGEGPTIVIAKLDRICSHTCSDDQRVYRSPEDLAEMKQRDPVETYSQRLIAAGELTEADWHQIKTEIDARVETEVQHQKLQRDENRNVIGFPRPALYHDAAGYKITPHPDTPLKIVTMQFYLPANDSQQELGTSLFRMKSGLERALSPLSGKFKTVKKFPFLPNTGYAFAVTQNSWHGRETVIEKQGDRCSIITFYLREDVRLKY